jgi:Domain of unknown function (DUF4082)
MNIIKTAIFLFFLGCGNAISQVSFWNNSTNPNSPDTTNDTSALTLGLQFYSDTAGSVTGVRFFKGTQNTGQHIGVLWSSTGTQLAQVTFTGETASGWQQANFATPVSISANTTYVISYFAPKGNYAVDVNYSWSTLSSPPLHPASTAAGVYVYGGTAAFPAAVNNACNYWVDPIFTAGAATQPSPVTSSSTSFWTTAAVPSTPAFAGDSAAVTLGLQFSSDVAGSITGVRFYKGSSNSGPHVATLWSSTGSKLAEVTVSGETASGWQQATFSTPVSILANTTYVVSYLAPNGNYAYNGSYSWSGLNATPLHVASSSPGVYAYGSGSSFPQGTNNGGNYWVDPVFIANSTTQPPPVTSTSSSFWTTAAVPSTPDFAGDSSAVTLGLKFTSDIAGSVTGVRFYKGSGNTGTHVATLWSSTGSKLAEVTVSGETASGWQQANFSAPVSILAGTTYVVSYLAPNGNYAYNGSYSWSALTAAPLHVASTSPGVYAYGSSSSFPQGANNGGNYWVDPVFSSVSAPPTPVTYSISGTVTGVVATLTVSGAAAQSATTGSNGTYMFTGLANGSYVVAPSKAGYTFSPSTAAVVINGASVTGVNFAGSVTPHSTTISWAPSTSSDIQGYHVYRATSSGGPYVKLTASPVSGMGFVDSSVSMGQTYYYCATAVDTSNRESGYSNVGVASIPMQ